MKNKLKDAKGVIGSDAVIAVIIIALFTGLIATITYNIFLANSSITKISKVTGYIVDVFEYIDKSYYDDVTEEKIKDYFNNKYTDAKIGSDTNTPFKASIEITNYNTMPGNENKLDLIKEIKMTVEYKLGIKKQTIEMKRIKSREKLITPNKPDLISSDLDLQEGEYVYPIKKVNNVWKICEENDTTWYDYEAGKWATIIKAKTEYKVGTEINIKELPKGETLYTWIPRYGYNGKDIKFLYSNTNKYIIETEKNIKTLSNELDSKYTISNDFSSGEGKQLMGKWISDNSSDAYTHLNDVYPLTD